MTSNLTKNLAISRFMIRGRLATPKNAILPGRLIVKVVRTLLIPSFKLATSCFPPILTDSSNDPMLPPATIDASGVHLSCILVTLFIAMILFAGSVHMTMSLTLFLIPTERVIWTGSAQLLRCRELDNAAKFPAHNAAVTSLKGTLQRVRWSQLIHTSIRLRCLLSIAT